MDQSLATTEELVREYNRMVQQAPVVDVAGLEDLQGVVARVAKGWQEVHAVEMSRQAWAMQMCEWIDRKKVNVGAWHLWVKRRCMAVLQPAGKRRRAARQRSETRPPKEPPAKTHWDRSFKQAFENFTAEGNGLPQREVELAEHVADFDNCDCSIPKVLTEEVDEVTDVITKLEAVLDEPYQRQREALARQLRRRGMERNARGNRSLGGYARPPMTPAARAALERKRQASSAVETAQRTVEVVLQVQEYLADLVKGQDPDADEQPVVVAAPELEGIEALPMKKRPTAVAGKKPKKARKAVCGLEGRVRCTDGMKRALNGLGLVAPERRAQIPDLQNKLSSSLQQAESELAQAKKAYYDCTHPQSSQSRKAATRKAPS